VDASKRQPEKKPARESQPVQAAQAKPAREEPPAAEQPAEKKPAPKGPPPAPAPAEKPKPAVPAAAAPSIRQLARELGVDIAEVAPGPNGRISAEEVKQHARRLIHGAPAPPPAPAGAPARETVQPLPDFAQWGEIERQPMSRTRRTIADTMYYAWTHVPHVTQYDRADITELETFRKAHAAGVEKAGGKLSVTSILVKIAASALRAFPQFNASVDSERNEIIYKKYCHIAVAVDTDRGLLVPVIRDVDKKSIVEVSVELTELARKARDKQIMPDELAGGCFTVSNLGGIGGTTFAPIVYWPQVAILGICRSAWEAVPRDGAIRERLILPLSLSFDHRIIDGADGARFLHWVAQALEQPLLMML
jgi:pyruvate dehydrogenase E2 component (dihydrolipoamide acetyltransferase)